MRAVLGEELGCTVSTAALSSPRWRAAADDSSNAETTAPTTALNDGSDIGCYTCDLDEAVTDQGTNGTDGTDMKIL